MKDILAGPQQEVLKQFAWSNVLIGLDFDGTLAPIVERPDNVRVRQRTRSLLVSLATEYPVAILSGRARDDVAPRLRRVPVRAIVGNHGLEPGGDLEECRKLVSRWIPKIEALLAGEQGLEVEDKSFSVAIHYRRSRTRRASLARIRSAVASLGRGTRVIGGKLVINVLPAGAPHKGIALMRLRDELGADTALYVGDDATDEDVFALDDPGRLLCIRVGHHARSRAPYFVASQREVDDLLSLLVSIRRDGGVRAMGRVSARG